MNQFHASPTLDDFLDGIENYLSEYSNSSDKEIFLKYVHEIPNVQKVFIELMDKNPNWVQVSKTTAPKFLLDIISVREGEVKPTKLELCNFEQGTQPVIKITVYNSK